MARKGDIIDKFFEFDSVTGIPIADLKSFDGVGALAVIAALIFTKIDNGPPTELWVGRFTIPTTAALASYIIEGSVVENSVQRRIVEPIEVRTTDLRSELDDVAAPGNESQFGTFAKEKLNRINILTARTADAQINIPVVEVESLRLVITVPAITAGDTPLFEFKVRDPTAHVLVDLTGATVNFKGIDAANPSVIAWNNTCTIVDAVNGRCENRLTATDTATPNLYDGIVTVSLPGNITLTAPTFPVNILPAAA